MRKKIQFSRLLLVNVLTVVALGTLPALRAQTPPCELYCENFETRFMDICSAEGLTPEACDEKWTHELPACIEEQCAIEVAVPDLDELTRLAQKISSARLGPEFAITSVTLHCWDTENCDPAHGSYVFSLETHDRARQAFLEMGASLYTNPILSMGIDTPPAAEVLDDYISLKIQEERDGGPYSLQRRFGSAAHPVLEYSDGTSTWFFSVGTHEISDVFEYSADPDADPMLEALRIEDNKRFWMKVLETYQ